MFKPSGLGWYGAAPTWLLTAGKAIASGAGKAATWAAENPETVQQAVQTGTQAVVQWRQNAQGQMVAVDVPAPAYPVAPAPVYTAPAPASSNNQLPIAIAVGIGGLVIVGALVARRR